MDYGKAIPIHLLLYERAYGPRPKNMEVHHIDFDHTNYALSNLELVSKSDHRKIHCGWLRNEDGVWTHKPCGACKKVLPLDCFYPRKGKTPSGKCRPCHLEYTRQWAKNNPEKRKTIANRYARRYYREHAEELKKKTRIYQQNNKEKQREYQRKYRAKKAAPSA